MFIIRLTISVAAIFLWAGLLPAYSQSGNGNRSFDPTTETTEPTISPLLEFLIRKGTSVSPLPLFAPRVDSYSIKSPDGAVQSIYVLADGVTFVAGAVQESLREEDKPHSPDVIALGEISLGVEGWLPRAWMGQSLLGVLYTFPDAPLPVRGYAYRFFPGRNIIDNLSAIQLAKSASSPSQ